MSKLVFNKDFCDRVSDLLPSSWQTRIISIGLESVQLRTTNPETPEIKVDYFVSRTILEHAHNPEKYAATGIAARIHEIKGKNSIIKEEIIKLEVKVLKKDGMFGRHDNVFRVLFDLVTPFQAKDYNPANQDRPEKFIIQEHLEDLEDFEGSETVWFSLSAEQI